MGCGVVDVGLHAGDGDRDVAKLTVKRKKREPEITIGLPLSVGRDLVHVLRKFSEHKMTLLKVGDNDQATRLLKLNLWRVGVEEKLWGKKQ